MSQDFKALVATKAADIVVAILQSQPVPPHEVPELLRSLIVVLEGDSSAPAATEQSVDQGPANGPAPPEASRASAARPKPAVPIDQSITTDYVISLEDGKPYRSLRRHLMAKYGMTPDDYRKKWGLPSTYPMVAPSYSEGRSEVAKRIGLGVHQRRQGRSA